MRDGARRQRASLKVTVPASVAAGVLASLIALPAASASVVQSTGDVTLAAAAAPYAMAPGVNVPGIYGSAISGIPAVQLAAQHGTPLVRPLGQLHPADLLVIAPQTLPATALAAIAKLPGVSAADLLDAARIEVNGNYVATLGVNPSTFRAFAARPTAESDVLWQNVADGGIAVSYLMGQQQQLPLGGSVTVAGVQTEQLQVGGFGTVGISGVDAVVSDEVARSLGFPVGNAIVISAPNARLSTLVRQVAQLLPKNAAVAPLVAQVAERGLPASAGSAGAISITASSGPGLTVAQTEAFLTAALSRVGMPYVWGGAGPSVFDCSGLVQWSMRQAGIVMPRVAVDQAQTGPQVPVADLQPGDLLFYHTDPTAPTYISHVAIYLGNGMMLQAPEPGEDVQIVSAAFGAGFAGAVRVYPRVAAAVAGNIAG